MFRRTYVTYSVDYGIWKDADESFAEPGIGFEFWVNVLSLSLNVIGILLHSEQMQFQPVHCFNLARENFPF